MAASSAVQLSFALRTTPQCKTVHLLGSWDLYQGQLPLSKDSSGSGGGYWKGTFRFQSTTLQRGQRYWYYYIIDGYHVSHDPCQESTTEPTTGRVLNILDVPSGGSTGRASGSSGRSRGFAGPQLNTGAANEHYTTQKMPSPMRYKRHSRNTPDDIPLGRPVSPSQIISPLPKKKNAAAYLTTTDLSSHATVERLTKQFARYANISPSGSDSSGKRYSTSSFSDSSSDIDSDCSSVPSLVHTPNSATSGFSPATPSYDNEQHSMRRPKTSGGTSSRSSPSSYTMGTSPSSTGFSLRSPASSRTSQSPKSVHSSASHRRPSSSSSGSARSYGGTSSSNSSRSRANSSASSRSSRCECERFGVTRKGSRVRLDCGGGRCGYGFPLPDSESCSDADSDSLICDSADASPVLKGSEFEGWGLTERGSRHGVVIRSPGRGRTGYV